MTPELCKLAHEVLVKKTLPVLKEAYDTLGVTLKPEDLDPESWYGGVPHPVTGEILNEKYQIPAMLKDLFGGIAKAGPFAVSKNEQGKITAVWSKKAVPTPLYEYGKGNDHSPSSLSKQTNNAGKTVYGKFVKWETVGLGATGQMALKMWGPVVLSLPLLDEIQPDFPSPKQCQECPYLKLYHKVMGV